MPRNCLKSDTVAGLMSFGAFSADDSAFPEITLLSRGFGTKPRERKPAKL